MGSIAQDISPEIKNLGWNLESEYIKSKLTAEEFQVLEKEMNAVLERLGSKPKNRGTQTSEGQDLSSSVDFWCETNKSVQKSLEDLSRRILKIGSESNKLNSERYDEDENCGTVSSQIKERFTMLNLKLDKQVPEDYKICLDCQQFKPQELKVVVKDGCLTVHGKHDVKLDEHGLIKREFTRRWTIPEDVKFEKFSCLLDRHGILTIQAPRKPTAITVPIQIE